MKLAFKQEFREAERLCGSVKEGKLAEESLDSLASLFFFGLLSL